MKKIWLVLSLVVVLVVGCEKETPSDPVSLVGTKWDFVGIVDMGTNELTEIKPADCEDCYMLTFISDSVMTGPAYKEEGIHVAFALLGQYNITDIVRHPADEKFIRALYHQNTTSYSITTDEIRFINQINKYYLLYKRRR